MTVKNVESVNREVHCMWFAGNILNHGYFPAESLITVGEDKAENGQYPLDSFEMEDKKYYLLISGITFDRMKRTLLYKGHRVYFTPHEALVIEYFLRHPGVTITHEEIISQVHSTISSGTKPTTGEAQAVGRQLGDKLLARTAQANAHGDVIDEPERESRYRYWC